ncbi:MAG: hypothetical protein IK094_07355 [Treponema sp.]|nr:hypothetical protein [Treponema sp.]
MSESDGTKDCRVKPDNDTVAATGNDCKAENGGGATESIGKPKSGALNPVAALAICAILWSFGGVIIKLIKWDALAIAGVRSLLGMITLTIAFRRPPKLFVRRAENDGKPKTAAAKIDARATVNLL